MSNLFSGLESLGLGNMSGMDIFDKKENAKKAGQADKAEAVELKEEDFILDKTIKCPACDTEFKYKAVKTGKAKLMGQDIDLRPKYQIIDTLKYDAVLCERCGYAALTKWFSMGLTSGQSKFIREGITKNFRGVKPVKNIMTYDDAILRHKLALASAVVKKGKISERAYICLKLGWLLRGKAETLPQDTPNRDEVIKQLNEEELSCLSNAYEGFNEAFSKENFPMCGMDANTVTYITAVCAMKIGKFDDSLRLTSTIIQARDANDRLKDKARELKESIKALQSK